MSDDQELMNVYGRHGASPDPDLTDELMGEVAAQPGTTVELAGDDIAGGPYFDSADADLASDPFADDLDSELAARASRRLANRTTTVLLGLALLVGGFLAGAQVQKHWGAVPASASNSGTGNGVANVAGGGFGGRGAKGGNGANAGNATNPSSAASNAMTGTVKLVDGTTVYLQMANGDVVTVKTTGSTSVQVAQAGSLSQLAPGTQVTVEGQSGGQGIVNATKLTATK